MVTDRREDIMEKRIVKPYLLKEQKENEEYRWRIMDALEDINLFMEAFRRIYAEGIQG